MQNLYVKNCLGINVKWFSEYPNRNWPLALTCYYKVGFQKCMMKYGEPGSVLGIATAYGLDGPGIESRWGEIFRTCPDRP